MSTKLFDSATMFWDAEAFGTFVIGTIVSATVDLKAADIDEHNPGEIIAKWPGLDSGGAMTLQIVIADSADDSTFITLWTGPAVAWTLAEAQAEMADWRFKLPSHGLRRYVKVSLVIGTANASAGVLHMGLVK